MFFGTYEYQLDAKNRLVIPSKFREELGSNVFLQKGYDGCLTLLKEEDFMKMAQNLSTLQFEKEAVRSHERALAGSTEPLEIDKQGRLQIPLKFIKKYGFEREITIVGVFERIEIWPSKKYEEYLTKNEDNFEKNAEELVTNEN